MKSNKQTKMLQLRNIIEDCICNKFKKYKLTPDDVEYLILAYNGLSRDEKYITFRCDIARICKKCGFTVVNPHDDEINYYISVD